MQHAAAESDPRSEEEEARKRRRISGDKTTTEEDAVKFGASGREIAPWTVIYDNVVVCGRAKRK
jgi:hypothetical protein